MGIGSNIKQKRYFQDPFLVFWSVFSRISGLKNVKMTDVNLNAIIASAIAMIDGSKREQSNYLNFNIWQIHKNYHK